MSKLEIYGIALLVGLIVLGATAGGCYFYGRHDGTVVERAKWESDALKAQQQDLKDLKSAIGFANKNGLDTLEAVRNIKIINRTITGQVQREISTNTVYANDCVPASGQLLWNAFNKGVVPVGATGQQQPSGVPGGAGTPGR